MKSAHYLFAFFILLSSLSAVENPPQVKSPTAITKQDVLSVVNGEFQLGGQRFAEISFNKFDLFWAMHDELLAGRELNADNAIVQSQDKALKNLRQLGFRSVRVFAMPPGANLAEKFSDPKEHRMIFEALDKMVELCELHGIGLVWSLCCGTFTNDEIHLKELVADRENANRKVLYEYLDFVIDRYKHSPAVLMWEIHNELTLNADIGIYNGHRTPTLKEVAVFYDDVAKHIKKRDPLRLVNNGGSNPRESQWNLHLGNGWKVDTVQEQAKCFRLLFKDSAVDVIDIHFYPNQGKGVTLARSNGRPDVIGLADYMRMAARNGKPMIVGEIGRLAVSRENVAVWQEAPNYFETFADKDAAMPWVQSLLDDIIKAKVPLSYWWTYQSDREMDKNNPQRFDISLERNPELVKAVAEANKRLKKELRIPN
ncbi:MAG: cellulase family glycosylhydrolase [Terrimicrobiaceae bacterium]